MQLSEMFGEIKYTLLQGSMEIDVSDIIYDSRKVKEGTVFVCMTGAVADGHRYIPDAVKKGASAIVIEREKEATAISEEITVILVESARYALALMSAAYFGYPSRKLTTIGITGTKGKTTTTYIIQDVLQKAGKKVGLIGTIAVMTGEEVIPAVNTTPESYELQRYMAMMVKAGCEYLVMEVSSQGLKLDRTAGITFDYGVFTNLSPDHIGPAEHADFDEYLYCKSLLFKQCKTGVVNADDKYTERILSGATCDVITFSVRNKANAGEKDDDVGNDAAVAGNKDDAGNEAVISESRADIIAYDAQFLNENGKLGISFRTKGMMNTAARIHIPGWFSVYNALTTMAVCSKLGIADDAILAGLEDVQVKGRVEMISVSTEFSVIIDYAHNELSTRSALSTLLQYEPTRLIAVFGCGGNRSKRRRYDIGEAAGELADLCILTSDNPRFEEVSDINNDIKEGLAGSDGNYVEIEDRKEAIAYAITHAQPGDMIIMLGKGHEDYIEIKGVKHHFSEHEAIAEIVDEIKAGERQMENEVTLI